MSLLLTLISIKNMTINLEFRYLYIALKNVRKRDRAHFQILGLVLKVKTSF